MGQFPCFIITRDNGPHFYGQPCVDYPDQIKAGTIFFSRFITISTADIITHNIGAVLFMMPAGDTIDMDVLFKAVCL